MAGQGKQICFADNPEENTSSASSLSIHEDMNEPLLSDFSSDQKLEDNNLLKSKNSHSSVHCNGTCDRCLEIFETAVKIIWSKFFITSIKYLPVVHHVFQPVKNKINLCEESLTVDQVLDLMVAEMKRQYEERQKASLEKVADSKTL